MHRKTTKFSGESLATWTPAEPTTSATIHVLAAATNIFPADSGTAIGRLDVVHRATSGVENIDSYPLLVGDHVQGT